MPASDLEICRDEEASFCSSPPITAAALRGKGWDKADVIRALRTGVTPDGDVFGGTMAEVVREGTAFLLPMHSQDLATYLLDEE